MNPNTREEWLHLAVDALRPLFDKAGSPLPADLKVSCGWPARKALRGAVSGNRAIGQCFSRSASAGGHTEIFISPVLDDRGQVLATLVHELVHAIDDCTHGHKGPFAKIARRIGLEGKLTATHAGEELARRLNALDLPPYPHAKLDVTRNNGPKQSTRLIKVSCPDCGYTVRATRFWLAKGGAPICPTHNTPMTIQQMTLAKPNKEEQ